MTVIVTTTCSSLHKNTGFFVRHLAWYMLGRLDESLWYYDLYKCLCTYEYFVVHDSLLPVCCNSTPIVERITVDIVPLPIIEMCYWDGRVHSIPADPLYFAMRYVTDVYYGNKAFHMCSVLILLYWFFVVHLAWYMLGPFGEFPPRHDLYYCLCTYECCELNCQPFIATGML